MELQKGINRARQLANLQGKKDTEFYKEVVNWLEELNEYRNHKAEKKPFHGMSDTRIYHIWAMMKNRCNNAAAANYKYYGGRGIKVCDEWKGREGFWNFYNWAIRHGYEETLTIDRIDVNGNYEPNNCRWVTTKEQANNKTYNGRKQNIIIDNSGKITLTYKNTTLSLREWSKRLDISYPTLYNRLRKGWSTEKILETPLNIEKSNATSGRKKKSE